MTQKTNARFAGFTFLIYIATGITSMVLFGQATTGTGAAAKLASIAQHASIMRLNILLTLLCAGYALVLAVTLYALTRDEDRDLAVMALCCRVAEGVIIAVSTLQILALLSVATASTTGVSADVAGGNALGNLLLTIEASTGIIPAICFAFGSTIFSYLFLRARSIPVPLAWLGLVASILLVVVLPLQFAGFIHSGVANLFWLPMLMFEVPLGLWLIIKGVDPQRGKVQTSAAKESRI